MVITDVFRPVLGSISVAVNGVQAPQTAYQYDTAGGLFKTTAGAITIPAATYTVQQDGSYIVDPGVTTVTVTGTI